MQEISKYLEQKSTNSEIEISARLNFLFKLLFDLYSRFLILKNLIKLLSSFDRFPIILSSGYHIRTSILSLSSMLFLNILFLRSRIRDLFI